MSKAPPRPWQYAEFDEAEQANVKRLMGDETYKHAVNWLLYKACGLADLSYRSDSSRDSDFAEGKRFVALQFVRAAMLPAKPKPEPQKRRSPRGTV